MTTGATILVVEDNPINLKLAADLLECEQFTVVRATDADHARQLLQNVRPDLILVDIQMPGMDGLTLTRLLKADPAYRDIPIAALTAFAMRGDDQKALAAGCLAYLTKPIDTRRFAAQVTEILQQARPAKKPNPRTSSGYSGYPTQKP